MSNVRDDHYMFITQSPLYKQWVASGHCLEYCICGMIWRVSDVDEILNMDGLAHKYETLCDGHIRLPLDKNATLRVLMRLKKALVRAAPPGQ